MKIKEAKEIVGAVIAVSLYGMLETEVKIDLRRYSLKELIKANDLVKSNRSRADKIAEHHRKKGHKSKGRTIPMTIDERGIAAVYTLLHFQPTTMAIMSYDGLNLALISDEDLKEE